MTGDQSVKLSLLEKKPPLSLLSIDNLSTSKEGRGGHQILPKRLNKMFSTKTTHATHLENAIKSLMAPCFQHINKVYVPGSVVTDRQTHILS